MPSKEPKPELVMTSSTGMIPSHVPSAIPDAVVADQEVRRDADEQHAVCLEHQDRANERRQVSAHQATERHAAAERQHVDAHYAAAHFVGGDELYERGDRREG